MRHDFERDKVLPRIHVHAAENIAFMVSLDNCSKKVHRREDVLSIISPIMVVVVVMFFSVVVQSHRVELFERINYQISRWRRKTRVQGNTLGKSDHHLGPGY